MFLWIVACVKCLLCANLPTGCSSSATFEREGDPRRWHRMCRGEMWNCETLGGEDFCELQRRYHEDMKIWRSVCWKLWKWFVTHVVWHRKVTDNSVTLVPDNQQPHSFCLRSCHGLSVCLDVWTWAQVLKFSQKKKRKHRIRPLIYVCNIYCSLVGFQLIRIDLT